MPHICIHNHQSPRECPWCLRGENERLQREKQARIYYQEIVYEICAVLDAIEARDIRYGEGIVCGTLETPQTGTQDAIQRVRSKIERLQSIVDDLAKAHASGGFIELDADLAEQLAAEAKET